MRLLFCILFISLASLAGETSFEVSPLQEGIYEVKVECRDPEPVDLCQAIEGERSLVVMNSPGYAGIIVSIANTELQLPIYSFNYGSLKDNGRILDARSSFPSSVAATLNMEFRSKEGSPSPTVFGFIRDPRFPADLRVTGFQTYSPSPLFVASTSGPLTMGEVVGVYEGESPAGGWLRLTLRPSIATNGAYIASLQTSIGTSLSFTYVNFDPNRRLLQLIAPQSSQGTALKWILRFDEGADPENVTGAALVGQSARMYPLSLKKKN